MTPKPCPFCGGKAEIRRELNADTLTVDHVKSCFLRHPPIARFHWNEAGRIPAEPFADWNTRKAKK